MWWLQAILFFLLSPGVVLTLPPVGSKVLFSGKTSVVSAFVHALVFAVVSHYVWAYYKANYMHEGFRSPSASTGSVKPGAMGPGVVRRKEGFQALGYVPPPPTKVKACPWWKVWC